MARPEEVLRDSDRPSRRSYDIATFNAGIATLPGWDPGDREAIGRRRSNFHEFKGVVRFRLRDRRIPPSRALESDYSFGPSYRGGGFESPEAGYDSLTPITWPAGWTVVEALAFDRELRVKPSPAGLAAAALLERIGSIPAVSAIASERVVEMLYRLAERSGMTWFRRKLREIGGAVEDGDRPRLEQALDSLSVGDDDEQRQETTFSALVEPPRPRWRRGMVALGRGTGDFDPRCPNSLRPLRGAFVARDRRARPSPRLSGMWPRDCFTVPTRVSSPLPTAPVRRCCRQWSMTRSFRCWRSAG